MWRNICIVHWSTKNALLLEVQKHMSNNDNKQLWTLSVESEIHLWERWAKAFPGGQQRTVSVPYVALAIGTYSMGDYICTRTGWRGSQWGLKPEQIQSQNIKEPVLFLLQPPGKLLIGATDREENLLYPSCLKKYGICGLDFVWMECGEPGAATIFSQEHIWGVQKSWNNYGHVCVNYGSNQH